MKERLFIELMTYLRAWILLGKIGEHKISNKIFDQIHLKFLSLVLIYDGLEYAKIMYNSIQDPNERFRLIFHFCIFDWDFFLENLKKLKKEQLDKSEIESIENIINEKYQSIDLFISNSKDFANKIILSNKKLFKGISIT